MKTGTMFRRMAAILAVILMISLFAIPTFADEAQTTEAATEASSTVAETTAPATEAETTAVATDEHGHPAGSHDEEEQKGMTTQQIVSLCIIGGIILVAVVLCIIFRKKVGKGLRVYKSETGKISWLPWEQTRKSTWVVLIVLILSALAICLIDFGLSEGFFAFIDLFQKA